MSDSLATAAQVGGVELLAIVDDAYDPPRGDEISEDAFNRFVQSMEDNPQRIASLAASSMFVEADLDDWENFANRADLIDRLWNLNVGVVTAAAMTEEVIQSLEILFSDVSQDRISKLQQLRPLEALLAATKVRVMKLGADPEPALVAQANVVFLDLFLSSDIPPNPAPGVTPRSALDRARERATRYLEDVRQQTAGDIGSVAPAFILISSLGTQQIAQNFRKKTTQTASRFRFVQKQAIERADPQDLLAIAEIFRTCRASAVLEPLRKALPIVIEEARNWVADRLIGLEIADFARLYELSLQAEGQPVEDYIKEVVAGAVAERVMCAFSKHTPTTDRPNPFADVPSHFIEAPSNAMAELYNATRTTQDRGYRGPDDTLPLSGDLFLEGTLPKSSATPLYGRTITAVMTPICDLMSRNGGEPAATAVLMLQGTLRPTYHKHQLDPQMVILNGKFYEVDWELKHPQALPLKTLRQDIKAKKRIWLGRLKAEHFLSLQSQYLSSFARVGLLKAPAIFEPLAGKICVREAGALIELGEPFDAKSAFAFQSPQTGKEPSKQPVFFTGAFLTHFRSVLQQTVTSADRAAATRTKAQGLLDRMNQLVTMVSRRPPNSHGINDYLRVDLLSRRDTAVTASADGVIIIVLKY
ncbi:hypothetical protein [Sphingomonas immobilis]|uniref:Uncharacterized protein n=1 Tax=Sphingomonas immobilis TaxID=3063997 RepID=A0ABT9A149_9SPHN|nr:hypothetical protein [Sphingomonas sp. CA1-15]MDO7843552.1 hypothetical protein [Sphingomonas sp. CA1-15]